MKNMGVPVDGFGNKIVSRKLIEYETQSGNEFTSPSGAVGNGRIVIVYNSVLGVMQLYVSANGVWHFFTESGQTV